MLMAIGGLRVRRRWGILVGAVVVLSLLLLTVGVPRSASRAAQGQLWLTGVHYAGVLETNSGLCSVTVVSEFLVITAKHCGRVNPSLKLNVSSIKEPGHWHPVKEIVPNRDMDVQAIMLRDRTGLSVSPLRDTMDSSPFYLWGYGLDRANNNQGHLTRAEFDNGIPIACSPIAETSEKGDLCWQVTAKNSVCNGDTGGPITQGGAIVGMQTRVWGAKPEGGVTDCGKVTSAQALTVRQMRPWLDQMISDADPFD